MTLVSEVADVIKMLGEVVNNTREIVDAVNDGRKFLASRHPEAQQDFSDLLRQIQRTIKGLAKVTKVVRSFRFVSGGGTIDRETADRELARFNDYVIKQKEDIAKLKNQIRKLKANCDKVRVLRDKLDARTKSRSWGSLFGLFGAKAQQRSLELHGTLSNFYADDQRMIELFRLTLELAENAIKDVEGALGPPGIANPYSVPAAASILQIYAVLFDAPQNELHRLADILGDAQTALRPS
jgi:hypothetical protein